MHLFGGTRGPGLRPRAAVVAVVVLLLAGLSISGPFGSAPAAVAAAESKPVFAHYFPPYPISIDNAWPAADYYSRNYLNPAGEGGRFAAVGGLLRDRPIPRDPVTGTPAAAASSDVGTVTGLGSGRCVDVAGGATGNETAVQLFDCNGTGAQAWRQVGETIVNPQSGRCLDVAGGSLADGTVVQLFDCNGTGAQRWRLSGSGIVNTQSGKCLDALEFGTGNATRLQQWACGAGQSNQNWTWRPGSAPAPGSGGSGPVNYRLVDAQTEIAQAQAAGIDGFAVDLLSASGSNWEQTKTILRAAELTNGQFTVLLQPDMTAGFGQLSPADMAARLAELAASPAVYRIDGKVVVSPFKAEAQSPAWYADMLARMGTPTAFYPLFLNASANMANFAAISVGFSEWGTRDANGVSGPSYSAGVAAQLGRQWMAPISVQDYRPNGLVYDEARNTTALRESWKRAITDGSDAAILLTWNDYSESTSFAPSVNHGYAFVDLSAYYASWFQRGSAPAIGTDQLVLSHRVQDTSLVPTGQTSLARLRSTRTPTSNQVEVVSLLTAPATVTARVGGQTESWDAPAGLTVHYLPLSPGSVSASATRGGQAVATVSTAKPIVTSAAVQDLSYHAAVSGRPLPRQH